MHSTPRAIVPAMLVLLGLLVSLMALPRVAGAEGPVFEGPGFEGPVFEGPVLNRTVVEGTCVVKVFSDRNVRCGTITVPLDRNLPTGMQVTLPYIVFEAPAATRRSDPIVYIDGGPGGSTVAGLGKVADLAFAGVIADRDLIVFDQRGTGFAEPSIRCTETAFAFNDNAFVDAMGACGDRLVSEGIDVSKFATDDVAADLEDLREALGYGPWNLFGISYGTTVAMAAARDFPDGVRTVTLDSAYPQGLNTDDLVPNASEAFDVLADGCRRRSACQRFFPQVADGFVDVVTQLNDAPAIVPVFDFGTGETVPFTVTGSDFVNLVFGLMYSADLLTYLPRLIAETSNGDYTMLSTALGGIDSASPTPDPEVIDRSAFVQERYFATECNERFAFLTREDMVAKNSPYPELWPSFYSTVDADTTFRVCEAFGAGQAPDTENDPVVSDVPALVLAGTFDPVTPPSWGEFAGEGFTVSTVVEIPNGSHGVSPANECAAAVMTDFLNDPTKVAGLVGTGGTDDTGGFGAGCLASEKAPKFQTTRQASRVRMRNVRHNVDGFVVRTKAPGSWEYIGGGIRVRDNGPLDRNTALVSFALAANTARAAIREAGTLFPDGVELKDRGDISTDSGTWRWLRVADGGLSFDVALSKRKGVWFAVVLVSEPDEARRLRRVVFKPALSRFIVASEDVVIQQETMPSPTSDQLSFVRGADEADEIADFWAELVDEVGPLVDLTVGTRVTTR